MSFFDVRRTSKCVFAEKNGKRMVLDMRKFARELTRQGFVALSLALAPVLLSLLVFAFCAADAEPLEIYVRYTKMLQYILSALLLAVGGGLLTDYIFRSPK